MQTRDGSSSGLQELRLAQRQRQAGCYDRPAGDDPDAMMAMTTTIVTGKNAPADIGGEGGGACAVAFGVFDRTCETQILRNPSFRAKTITCHLFTRIHANRHEAIVPILFDVRRPCHSIILLRTECPVATERRQTSTNISFGGLITGQDTYEEWNALSFQP